MVRKRLLMKVLLVSSSFFPKIDGSTRCVYEHARKLAERKEEVYLVTRGVKTENADLKTSKRYELFEGFRIFRTSIALQSSTGLNLVKVRLALEQILLILSLQRKVHFDVIHAHGFSACFAAIPCKFLYRVPLVLTTHGTELLWPKWVRWKNPVELRLSMPFEKLALNICDAVIAQSVGVRKYMLEFYGKSFSGRIRLIQTGVDHVKFSPEKKQISRPGILFAGALSEIKGLTLLIDAFARVHQRIPSAQLALAGSGPSLNRYKSYVSKLGLEDSVNFLGAVRDDSKMVELYRNSDVVVLPSNVGGPISCTILEGLSSGRPVISTNVPGGIPDVINSDVGALIERNDLEGLTSALLKLLEHSEYAMRIGKNAREAVVKYYTLDLMIDKLQDLYRSLGRET